MVVIWWMLRFKRHQRRGKHWVGRVATSRLLRKSAPFKEPNARSANVYFRPQKAPEKRKNDDSESSPEKRKNDDSKPPKKRKNDDSSSSSLVKGPMILETFYPNFNTLIRPKTVFGYRGSPPPI